MIIRCPIKRSYRDIAYPSKPRSFNDEIYRRIREDVKRTKCIEYSNKEQILEGSNLARISKLKELMKKGIITEEFLNKNSSLFQIEQPQYQTLTANIEFLKEKI